MSHRTHRLHWGRAICVLAALWIPSAAAADDFTRTGFYLGAGGSYAVNSIFEDWAEDELSGWSVDFENAPGFNVRAGFRFLRVLAAELEYEWLDDYDLDFSTSGMNGNVNVQQQTLTANLKLYPIPVWRIQPYILAGVGFQAIDLKGTTSGGFFTASDSDVALAARGALGLDVYITKHIAVYGEAGITYTDYEVDIPSAVGDDLPFVMYFGAQAGLIWRF